MLRKDLKESHEYRGYRKTFKSYKRKINKLHSTKFGFKILSQNFSGRRFGNGGNKEDLVQSLVEYHLHIHRSVIYSFYI